MFERRHVCERSREEITSKNIVANVADVIVPHKGSTSKVIDSVHGRNTQALNTLQQIFKSNQIPEMCRDMSNCANSNIFYVILESSTYIHI